jgi:uncharacterized RDD family membrane protein YckC
MDEYFCLFDPHADATSFLIAKSGQSIGKKITKIKIVDAETHTAVNTIRAFG